MKCPFKVGDKIKNTESAEPAALVIAITKQGFKWRYEEPYFISARLGYILEGECYEIGFKYYKKVNEKNNLKRV